MDRRREELVRLYQLIEPTRGLINFTLGQDENGAIEGYVDPCQIDFTNDEAECKLNVAYADQERTDYSVLRLRLWGETGHEPNDIQRVGWELLGLEDETVVAGPTRGYLPDLPQLARFPDTKRIRRAHYQFTEYELRLLRPHSGGKRERIRRMSPLRREGEMRHIFYLDDDEIIDLGITPAQPLTGADIQAGMIVRRDCHDYRIVVEVHASLSGEGVSCIYAPYEPQCAWDAVNPDFDTFPHYRCSTQELAEWTEKVVSWWWDDKVWHEDWDALEQRRQEALMGLFHMGRTIGTPAAGAVLEAAGVTAQSLFERHHRGDWGDVTPDDWQANERALMEGDRLLSVYPVGTEKVYVITEADRSATTIMLAAEY